MTKDGGQRIALAGGAMLADPACLGNVPEIAAQLPGEPAARIFEPQFWAALGALSAAPLGRGSSWFIAHGAMEWVLRHYRRGGMLAACLEDRYVFKGEARVRAFEEYWLLVALAARGLPVPHPIAAHYRRAGAWYRCDLITRTIANTEPLSVRLARAAIGDDEWFAIGATVARFHAAGVDHADLNAHNILVARDGAISIIDFDRGRMRTHGAWMRGNIARLHRSLRKISRERSFPPGRFSPSHWECLLGGYSAAAPHPIED